MSSPGGIHTFALASTTGALLTTAACTTFAVQAGGLDWDAAVRVLALVEGRGCEGAAASSQLDLLREAALCRLLHLLGSLDAMLNDEEQRERFCQLPLDVLEVGTAAQTLRLHAASSSTSNSEPNASSYCSYVRNQLPARLSHACCRLCTYPTTSTWTVRRQVCRRSVTSMVG